MNEARTVTRLSPTDLLDLKRGALIGEPRAVRLFVLRGVWKNILSDATVGPKEKFSTFQKMIPNIRVEYVPAEAVPHG